MSMIQIYLMKLYNNQIQDNFLGKYLPTTIKFSMTIQLLTHIYQLNKQKDSLQIYKKYRDYLRQLMIYVIKINQDQNNNIKTYYLVI